MLERYACVRVCVCVWGGGGGGGGRSHMCVCVCVCVCVRDRQTDRQTDKQTDRQTETETQRERVYVYEREYVCLSVNVRARACTHVCNVCLSVYVPLLVSIFRSDCL